jgi:hypothetical protein
MIQAQCSSEPACPYPRSPGVLGRAGPSGHRRGDGGQNRAIDGTVDGTDRVMALKALGMLCVSADAPSSEESDANRMAVRGVCASTH